MTLNTSHLHFTFRQTTCSSPFKNRKELDMSHVRRNLAVVLAVFFALLRVVVVSHAQGGSAVAVTTESALEKTVQTDKAGLLKSYGKLPLTFEANQGQASPEIKFLSRGGGYSLYLTSN